MRKLLLASAAMLGATVGMLGAASAQDAPWGAVTGKVITKANGDATLPNNNNNSLGTATETGVAAKPTPGTMVFHFNGRLQNEYMLQSNNMSKPAGTNIAAQTLSTYIRLYPGVDAMSSNGLRYGGSVELRQNFNLLSPATDANKASQVASNSYFTAETIYVRRVFSYIGSDQFGILRIGQGDSLMGLMETGATLQYLPSGVLDTDLNSAGPSGANATYAFFAGAGYDYPFNKFVYLSPSFAGFDVGVMYAPNTSNGFAGCGAPISDSCPQLSTSPVAGDVARPTDIYEVGARYQGALGPVGLVGYGVYTGSSHVSYGVAAPALTKAQDVANLSFYNLGLKTTFGGLTVGGNILGGSVIAGGWTPKPKSAPDEFAWMLGATYSVGPVIFGVVGEEVDHQGSAALVGVSQRHEAMLDVGVGYAAAPGLTLWAEWLYQAKHQGGFDFSAGAAGVNNNSTTSNMLGLGMRVIW